MGQLNYENENVNGIHGGDNNDNRSNGDDNNSAVSRRSFFTSTLLLPAASAFFVSNSQPAFAASTENNNEDSTSTTPTVQTPLYSILRVKEATEQESRLIKSGKFKDVQRANVKLAVRFMVDNYRLNDNFISASAFLNGDRKIKAAEIGQTTVQNLITILEYFDSSGVDNIKIASSGLGGKEDIVLKGLDAARKGIDSFVSLFPKEDVDAVVARIEAENELNRKEFDSELGAILNPKPMPTTPTPSS